MKKAVRAVIVEHSSHKKAARQYGVPRSSLIRYLKKARSEDSSIERNIGRPCVLTFEQENDLSRVIQSMESRLFGLTLTDVRKLVYLYCQKNRIPNNFSETFGMAGRAWMEGFRKRHPEISLRKPEAVSVQRASGFNRSKVNRFYEVLEGTLFTDGKRTIPPENIFNVDESGYTIVQKPHKVLAKSGKKNVGQITSGERGKNITTVCCVSAAGQYVPPMFIFPRKNMNPRLMDNAPPGSVGYCTPTGWINEEKFTLWFEHFAKSVQPQARDSPTLLIFDGHASHTRNIDIIEKAREMNMVLLCLPSHCTHKLQPLDVSFFKSTNWHYDEEVRTWMREHDGRRVTEFDVAGIFAKAYAKAATVKNAMSGYEKCGIHPFRNDIFTEEDFMGADFTDNPLPGPSSIPLPPQPNPNQTTDHQLQELVSSPATPSMMQTSTHIVHCETLIPVTRATEDIAVSVVECIDSDEGIPIVPGSGAVVQDAVLVVQQSHTTDCSQMLTTTPVEVVDLQLPLSSTGTPFVVNLSDALPEIASSSGTFIELVQVPKQDRQAQSSVARKRKVNHAQIITLSPYKNELKKAKLDSDAKSTTAMSSTAVKPSNVLKRGATGEKTAKPKTASNAKKVVGKVEDNAMCLYCKGTYKESVEGWIQCTGPCTLWAHNSCAGVGKKGPASFMCEICGDI